MKVAIIADRKTISYKEFCKAIKNSKFNITEVIIYNITHHVFLPKKYAEENKLEFTRFKPEENKHGLAAIALCNKKLLEYVDAIIFVNSNSNKDTINLSNYAQSHVKNIGLYYYNISIER